MPRECLTWQESLVPLILLWDSYGGEAVTSASTGRKPGVPIVEMIFLHGTRDIIEQRMGFRGASRLFQITRFLQL